MPLPPLGINLWQFHRQLENHLVAEVLSAVAKCGFKTIEMVGPIADPAGLRARLDALGLTCAARHMVLAELDDPAAVARSCALLGTATICSSGLRVWDQRSAEKYREAALALNAAGTALRRHGIALAYHHHDFEFEPVLGARTGMDLLMEHGDPGAWSFCIDVGWVQQAGLDPLSYLRTHRHRTTYVHLRDQTKDRHSTPLGRGIIDLRAIVHEIESNTRIRYAMVEQEPGPDPVMDAALSRKFLYDGFGW